MSFMQTIGGRAFYANRYKDGCRPYVLADIAWALSQIPRFTGHLSERYSVAEHSIRVAESLLGEAPLPTVQWGLLHDAHEAYINDISRPWKALLPDYASLEKQLQLEVLRAFDLDVMGINFPLVREMDNACLLGEFETYSAHEPLYNWTKDLGRTVVNPESFGSAEAAYKRFLELAEDLDLHE